MIYFKEETSSTNDDAKESKYTHGDVIWAERQLAGRGQRGHTWVSGEGLNVTFSVVLEASFLRVRDQFYISQITALALCDMLSAYGIEARIKWTNDIYVGDRKIVGILIENQLQGDGVARAVVGVGVNVNQELFDPTLPNPTSMTSVAGRKFDREEVLTTLHGALMGWFERLREGDCEAIARSYHERLYRLNELHPYRLASGEVIEARIEGVRAQGELVLRDESGAVRECLFRDVEFIIAGRDK